MRFVLYPNDNRDKGLHLTRHLIDLIIAHGGEACMFPDTIPDFEHKGLMRSGMSESDIVISLGGDGTFLNSLTLPNLEDVPHVGVNLGSVGFLLEILPEDLDKKIAMLFAEEYTLESRAILEGRCYDHVGQCLLIDTALNEVTLVHGGNRSVIRFSLSINGDRVENIAADGIIVATPTGSTAYSFSCGGPIVHPALDMMIITPICPHSLHNRTYITDSAGSVRLRLAYKQACAHVFFDGRKEMKLTGGGYVDVVRSSHSLPFVRFGKDDFYATLPTKIKEKGVFL